MLEWHSADNVSYVDITVLPPEPPYPAMVQVNECDFSLMLSYDARTLAQLFLTAADEADKFNQENVVTDGK